MARQHGANRMTPPPSPEALIQRLRELSANLFLPPWLTVVESLSNVQAVLGEAADALASPQEALRAALGVGPDWSWDAVIALASSGAETP